jgi:probable O-glycosylation ligase (exosortase A-associated)
MGAAFLLRAQRRVLAAALLSLAITVGALVVPDKWTDRMETIEHYDTDGSFQGRVNAWGMAWNLALDRPLTGGGFETFIWPVFAVYGPDPNNVHDVHSIYFEILGEHGFVAFGLWAGLILLTLLTLRGLMRQARRDPALAWTRHYPIMLETGILAYLVAGLALGQAYFDLFWNMVAMSIILRSLVDREARGRTTTPSLDSHAALEARVLVPARHAPGMRRR